MTKQPTVGSKCDFKYSPTPAVTAQLAPWCQRLLPTEVKRAERVKMWRDAPEICSKLSVPAGVPCGPMQLADGKLPKQAGGLNGSTYSVWVSLAGRVPQTTSFKSLVGTGSNGRVAEACSHARRHTGSMRTSYVTFTSAHVGCNYQLFRTTMSKVIILKSYYNCRPKRISQFCATSLDAIPFW
jgi:hypothetical protein